METFIDDTDMDSLRKYILIQDGEQIKTGRMESVRRGGWKESIKWF